MKKTVLSLMLVVAMLAGMTVAFADSVLPYDGEEIVYEGLAGDLGIVENLESEVYKAYLEKLGNVRIKWSVVPGADMPTKNTLNMNSGDMPDISWVDKPQERIRDYGDNGIFLDLNEYKEYMPNLCEYRKSYNFLNDMETTDGHMYVVMDIEPYDYISEGWFVNKTALAELDLEVPQTWDEMYAAMMAYHELHPEGMPFVSYNWGLEVYEACFGLISNAQSTLWTYDDAQSKWICSVTDENSGLKELIGRLADMYANGLIHPEFTTATKEALEQYILEGKWLFSFYYQNTIEKEIFQNEPTPFEAEPMITPANKEGDPRYGTITVRYDSRPGWAYIASAEVEHPEVMASLMDYIISEEASDFYNWGLKGITYDVDEKGNKFYLEDYATNKDRRQEIGINAFLDCRQIMRKARDSEYVNSTELGKRAYDLLANSFADGVMLPKLSSRGEPMFTEEEKEIIARSANPIKTYVDEQKMLFIDGTRSMDEWDAFVDEVKALGNVDEVLATYEGARQSLYGTERRIQVLN